MAHETGRAGGATVFGRPGLPWEFLARFIVRTRNVRFGITIQDRFVVGIQHYHTASILFEGRMVPTRQFLAHVLVRLPRDAGPSCSTEKVPR